VQSHNLPFQICLACDPYESGRSLFQEFAASAKVFNSGSDLLNHIRASGDTAVIHGYLINSYRFQTSEVTTSFWKLQLSIIAQLCLIRSLSIVVAVVIPDHDGRSISAFTRGLTAANWKLSSREVSYQEIGDSIADSCTIIIAIHSSCASKVEPITLKTPPSVTPRPIGAFVWEPFNRIEHSLSHGRDDKEFDSKKNDNNNPEAGCRCAVSRRHDQISSASCRFRRHNLGWFISFVIRRPMPAVRIMPQSKSLPAILRDRIHPRRPYLRPRYIDQ
jgi:hypothetical protein